MRGRQTDTGRGKSTATDRQRKRPAPGLTAIESQALANIAASGLSAEVKRDYKFLADKYGKK